MSIRKSLESVLLAGCLGLSGCHNDSDARVPRVRVEAEMYQGQIAGYNVEIHQSNRGGSYERTVMLQAQDENRQPYQVIGRVFNRSGYYRGYDEGWNRISIRKVNSSSPYVIEGEMIQEPWLCIPKELRKRIENPTDVQLKTAKTLLKTAIVTVAREKFRRYRKVTY